VPPTRPLTAGGGFVRGAQIDAATFERWWRAEMHPLFGGETPEGVPVAARGPPPLPSSDEMRLDNPSMSPSHQ